MARRRPHQLVTLALTVAITATLGATVYLAATSLPYLAATPTTDPTFGALNACLLEAVPARVGFAVSRDAAQVAAFSPNALAVCGPGAPPTARTLDAAGVVGAAFDGEGRLFVAQRADQAAEPRLSVLEAGGLRLLGDVRPQALVGHRTGVVAMEPSGRLVSVTASGELTGLFELGAAPLVDLSVSGDGTRLALVATGAVQVFDAVTLQRLRAEAPCEVERLWWLPAGQQAVVQCGPKGSWALTLDFATGARDTAADAARVPSVLVGPNGPFVEPCDGLPCTASPP